MNIEKKLLVVILTWNDYKNTIKCLESASNIQEKNIFFLLVDNNSTDKSIANIKKNFKFQDVAIKKYLEFKSKFLFLKNPINLGCGAGHNSGYEFAIKNDFEYVARIDNDMEFQKNFFKENLKLLDENLNIQALSPKIMYYFNPKQIWWMGCKIGNSLKFQTHMRDYPYHLDDKPQYKGLKTTDAIAGCASIMRTSRLKKVGLSDIDFFYGPEDVEFSFRLKTKNNDNSLIVNLDSKIYHKVTQSFGESLTYRKIYFEYKYRLLLLNKIGSFTDKLFGYTISLTKYLGYCLFFFKPNHRRKIRPVSSAIIDYFLFKRLGSFDRKNNNY